MAREVHAERRPSDVASTTAGRLLVDVPREDLRNLRFANWAKQLAQAKKLSTMSFFIGRGAVPARIRRLFLHILVGNLSETTFAAAALLLGGVFDCFPKLRVLLVHGDGCVPYQFGRMDRGQAAAPPFARGVAKSELNRYVYNLYYDTVLHDDLALRYLISRVGANYVALGTDFPFPLRDDDPVSTVKRQQLSQAEQRVVCWETSAALLGV